MLYRQVAQSAVMRPSKFERDRPLALGRIGIQFFLDTRSRKLCDTTAQLLGFFFDLLVKRGLQLYLRSNHDGIKLLLCRHVKETVITRQRPLLEYSVFSAVTDRRYSGSPA